MRKLWWIALLMLFFFAGCIRESNLSYNVVELASLQGVDVDGDGLFDISTYYYTPLSLTTGEEEVKVERLIYVRPTKFDVTAEGRNGSLELLQARVATALSKAEENVEDCRKLYCTTLPQCQGRAETKGEALALYSLSHLLGEFDRAKALLSTALIRYQQEGNLTDLYSAMARLMVVEKSIAQHPAVSYFRLCRVDKEYAHYEPITEVEFKGKAHEALEVFAFKAYNLESVAQITVKEALPFGISERVERLEVAEGKVVERVPLTIAYETVKMAGNEKASIALLVSGAFENDKAIFQHWKDVSLNVRLAAVQIPYMDELMGLLANIYGSLRALPPYMALALTFSTITALLLILDFFLSFAISFTSLYLKGRKAKEALRRAVGHVDIAWKRKLLFAALLFATAAVLEFYFSPEGVEEFSLASIRVALEDPIAFTIFLLYFTAVYFLLYVARDRIRALLGGSVSKESLAKGLGHLEGLVEELKALLEEMSSEGFDVSEEYEWVLSIPLEKMKKMLGKDNLRLSSMLYDYTRKAEEVRTKLENEKKMAEKNWEEWESYIRETLAGKEKVAVDSLIAIPKPWRMWAIQRYIREHPEENLYLDGRVVVREQLSLEEKLNRLLSIHMGSNLKAFLLMENGKVVKATSAPEDYLIKVLLYKIASSTDGEELEVNFKNSKMYMIRKAPYTLIGWGKGAKEAVTFLAKRL